MNRLSVLVCIIFLFTSCSAVAGKIYGVILVNGQPLPAKTKLTIACGQATYSANSKNHGRYSVNVKTEGACRLSANGYQGASAKVVSYRDPTKYNFNLTANGSRFTMQRQ